MFYLKQTIQYMSVFIQIVVLLVVLACMVMVLLAIRQLTHYQGFEDKQETNHLKEEVEEDKQVLSNNNIFSTLVEVDPKDYSESYKSKSKEPVSRRE